MYVQTTRANTLGACLEPTEEFHENWEILGVPNRAKKGRYLAAIWFVITSSR